MHARELPPVRGEQLSVTSASAAASASASALPLGRPLRSRRTRSAKRGFSEQVARAPARRLGVPLASRRERAPWLRCWCAGMASEKPYTWKQSHEEVTITYPIADAIKAKCASAANSTFIMHDAAKLAICFWPGALPTQLWRNCPLSLARARAPPRLRRQRADVGACCDGRPTPFLNARGRLLRHPPFPGT